jgi:hypothetical protein
MKKLIGNIFLPAILLIVTFSLYTCKNDNPTKAIITIVDTLNNKIPQVTVTLWQDTLISAQSGQKATARYTKVTDSGGMAIFEFQQEMGLNITATKGQDSVRDFIQLKEHHDAEKTVVLK